jgi:hypothetical protein
MQAGTNLFVPRTRRGTRQGGAFQNFLVWQAHATSKAAIGSGGKRRFFIKTILAIQVETGSLRALLNHLCL